MQGPDEVHAGQRRIDGAESECCLYLCCSTHLPPPECFTMIVKSSSRNQQRQNTEHKNVPVNAKLSIQKCPIRYKARRLTLHNEDTENNNLSGRLFQQCEVSDALLYTVTDSGSARV